MTRVRRWIQGVVVALALSLGALEPGPVAASTPAAAACTADTVLHGDTIVSLADLLSPGQACSMVCTKGKACGDSCIALTSTCRKPLECACDG